MNRRHITIVLLLLSLSLLGACAKKEKVIQFNARGFDAQIPTEGGLVFGEYSAPNTLDETIRKAENVVLCEVLTPVYAYINPDTNTGMSTVATVRIRESLLGDLSGEITVVTSGGFIPKAALQKRPYVLYDVTKADPNAQYVHRGNGYTLTMEPGGVYLLTLGSKHSDEVSDIIGQEYYYWPTIAPFSAALLNGDGKVYNTDILLLDGSFSKRYEGIVFTEDPIISHAEYLQKVRDLIQKYNPKT